MLPRSSYSHIRVRSKELFSFYVLAKDTVITSISLGNLLNNISTIYHNDARAPYLTDEVTKFSTRYQQNLKHIRKSTGQTKT